MWRGAVVGVLGLALVVGGCTGSDEGPDSSATVGATQHLTLEPTSGATQTDAPTADGVPGSVGADVEFRNASLHIEVAPIQVMDGVALLSVDYSLGADAPSEPFIALGTLLKPATGPIGVGGIRLVDVKNSEVLLVGVDNEKQPAATRKPLNIAPGQTVRSEAFFAAPSGESVDVLFPYLGLVRNVPVQQVSTGLPTSPQELGRTGAITYGQTPIDAFVASFDDSSSSRVAGTDVMVSLASDVLFAVDAHRLTAKARKVVDSAAKEIQEVAAAGEISVIGHTDDVASDAHNQELSEKRAQSVVAQLSKTVGSAFTLVAEGRGENEPVAGGKSPEARAANRRVEIRFQAKTAGTPVDVGEANSEAPKATGPVAAGSAPVTVTVSGKKFSVEVLSVSRAGSYLVGSLRVEGHSLARVQMTELFGSMTQGRTVQRGLPATTLIVGVHNLTLLGEGSRFYPADYVAKIGPSDSRAVLGDQFLDQLIDQGHAVTVTVLWPDPGGDTVTIDVPDRFRITDVSVTG